MPSKKTEAAILCGGRGERLRPLTDYFQKTMIPVGPRKLPLLAYIIGLVRYHGISRIALLTGYRSGDIRDFFGDGSQYSVKLRYSEDPPGRPGSLNAVANAIEGGAISKCDELLVYYGDVLSDLDISSLLRTHRSHQADATLVLARGYTLPVGVAEVANGGTVTAVREKPRIDLDVMTGCMVLGPNAAEAMTRIAGKKNTDLMTHFVPYLLASGGKVAAFYTEGVWHDVGTLTTFERLNEELAGPEFKFLTSQA